MSSDASLQKAIDLHRQERRSEAEALYRAFLKAQPSHGEANHNLGALLAQQGDMRQSLVFFQAALKADLSQGQYWISYARALIATEHGADALRLLERGRGQGLSGPVVDVLTAKAQLAAGLFQDAAAGLTIAAARQPNDAALWCDLGHAQAALGQIDDAIAAYRQALALAPDLADAHGGLGALLSEHGHVAEGFAHYMRRAALMHRPGDPAAQNEPEHKRKHDREQRDYLQGRGRAAESFQIANGERLAGPAVNADNATPVLLEQWRGSWPQMVVLDDFLTTLALERLRDYCAGSTIWHRVYDAGYIGATPRDGFACPLLAQIVEEIAAVYTAILGDHDFHYLGAFKYDSTLSTGTNTHADNSAVNVNFYIAPDQANLDPDSGGMDIWDVAVPAGDDMRRFNGDEALTRSFLAESNARMTRVPHRANRAVLFRSDLFHKTSDCRFREGYRNKRINVSLLFGKRGEATR